MGLQLIIPHELLPEAQALRALESDKSSPATTEAALEVLRRVLEKGGDAGLAMVILALWPTTSSSLAQACSFFTASRSAETTNEAHGLIHSLLDQTPVPEDATTRLNYLSALRNNARRERLPLDHEEVRRRMVAFLLASLGSPQPAPDLAVDVLQAIQEGQGLDAALPPDMRSELRRLLEDHRATEPDWLGPQIDPLLAEF